MVSSAYSSAYASTSRYARAYHRAHARAYRTTASTPEPTTAPTPEHTRRFVRNEEATTIKQYRYRSVEHSNIYENIRTVPGWYMMYRRFAKLLVGTSRTRFSIARSDVPAVLCIRLFYAVSRPSKYWYHHTYR
jgi:hypothetical protein